MDDETEAQEAQVRKLLVARVPYAGGNVLSSHVLGICPSWPGPLPWPFKGLSHPLGGFTVAAEEVGWGPSTPLPVSAACPSFISFLL